MIIVATVIWNKFIRTMFIDQSYHSSNLLCFVFYLEIEKVN